MDQGGPAVRAEVKDFGPRPAYVAGAQQSTVKPLPIQTSVDVRWQVHIPRTFGSYDLPVIHELLIRALDIFVSASVLLMAGPLIIFLAILIKLTSPGDVIYKQKRVGKHGRIFTLYKFRSMVSDAERHTGPVLASPYDQRVTPIGRVMRRMRLDELPQLFNVLRGDMSLVGPRPERPFFVYRHKALQGIRLSVRPGITGLAQVRGMYDLRPERKLRYDYLYIRNRSIWLNLSILFQTLPVVIRKTGW